MARFRGMVQGSRGPTTRLGHKNIVTTAQSAGGDVRVYMFASAEESGREEDWCTIAWRPHSAGVEVTLYHGPVRALRDPNAIVKAIVASMLESEFAQPPERHMCSK